MSAEAHRWLALNLRDIRDMSYEEINKTTGKTKVRYLGEDGLALLVFLCDSVNRKTHTVYMTAQTMCEETGISTPRTVYRLLAAFESWGWLTPLGQKRYLGKGRPTTEYHLTCVYGEPKPVPQDTKSEAIYVPLSDQFMSQGTHEKNTKVNEHSVSLNSDGVYPYPYPEPEPNPEPVSQDVAPQGGTGVDELVQRCIQRDLELHPTKAGAGLTKLMTQEYAQLVALAQSKYPEAPSEALVEWCVDERHHKKHSPYRLAELTPNKCGTCKGKKEIPGEIVTNDQGYDFRQLDPCPECRPQNVTPIDTHKRVNTGDQTNTDIPGGTASADTQLAIQELARQFSR